jgi:hypothetical protein
MAGGVVTLVIGRRDVFSALPAGLVNVRVGLPRLKFSAVAVDAEAPRIACQLFAAHEKTNLFCRIWRR